ncbi:MAG: right-handed parallel beta-helix repeat-containing protein [Bradymonadales bacterium]|nr:right-handed parallel beta-helix repeat-containing protein [Bradymonadales bacterium]
MNQRAVWLPVLGLVCLIGCGDDETPAVDVGPDAADLVSDVADVVEDPIPDPQVDLEVVEDPVPDPQAEPDLVDDTADVEEWTETPVTGCSPEGVVRFQRGSESYIAVYPHDWSAQVGTSYAWYDNTELYEWILTGTQTSVDYAAVLTEIDFPVVGTDGLPNIVPNPPRIPHWFSKLYYSPTLDITFSRATGVYGLADRSDTLEPDDIANELVDDDGNPLSAEDRETYEMLLLRHNRWKAAMEGLREVIDENFGYDAENLQCAFDNAEEGETIRLVHEEGEIYVLNQAIVNDGFVGTLEGQGSSVTVLKTVKGGFILPDDPLLSLLPNLFWFIEGDVVVQGFDIVFEGYAEWGSHYIFQASFGGFYFTSQHVGTATDEVSHIEAEVRDVRFFGQVGEEWFLGTNLIGNIHFVGEQLVEVDRFGNNLFTGVTNPLEGTLRVDGCESHYCYNGLALILGITDAEVMLTNNYGTGTEELFWISECNGGTYTISSNETENAGGLFMDEGTMALWGVDLGPTGVFPTAPCDVTVEDNIFRNAESWYAPIELHSYVYLAEPAGTSSTITFDGNTIESVDNFPGAENGFAYEGIFADGLDNGIITDNTFVGTGFAAVYIGPFETEDTGWTIENNSFADYLTVLADIYLGPETTGNTVVGKDGETTTLMDDGTGNTATNVTLVE